ncbi:MAG TPA: hypothetical protein VE575_16225 [Acidimicrobiales bacterium]|jgi:predicted amidophosphoribosyltransferase|nr:hypothetical protein [Acidimicrobiales bacterium]
MGFLGDLIEGHGWHVIAELTLLVVFTIFTAFYVRALLRGRVRAIVCGRCGRVASRADPRCARCGAPLERA